MAGASVATAAGSGLAAAKPGDTVEVNVGFSAESGRKAALDAASDVVRKFNSIDVVTIRGAKQAVTGLDQRADVR
jgi:subtilisin